MTNEINESATQRTLRLAHWDALASDPSRQWTPIECQRDAPAGFEVVFDPYSETITLFGPFVEQGVLVKTLTPWGGTFRVTGEDLLKSYVDVCQRGTGRDPHTRARELRAKLDGLDDLMVPEKPAAPDPDALARFIEGDDNCQHVMASFLGAINAAARAATTNDLQDFIQRATHDPAAAVLHYDTLRNGRLGIAPAKEKPSRAKRTAQPDHSPAGKVS